MKITGKKLLAVLCTVVMLVTTIVPSLAFTASAADTTITFNLGANGTASHKDGSSAKTTYSETVNGYTLNITNGNKMYPSSYDQKGNSAIKLGSSSAVGGFKFTVPADVTSVIIYIAKYKSNTTKINVNSTAYTLTKNSNDGEYDAITVDTTTTKTVTLTTVSGGVRAMVNTIEFVIPQGATVCEHANTTTKTNEATCTEKGSQKIVCDDCGAIISENDIAANGHNFVDFVCTECGVKVPSEATYVFSDYTAGTQYADNEEHKLDGLLTVITTASHFTSELRIYSSSTNNGYAILKSTVPMSELSFNAGNKDDILNIYGLVDGEWVLIAEVSVTSSYEDYTVNFGGKVYDEIKLDVQGTNQVRLKNITVSYHNKHNYKAVVTDPTYDAQGYTTYTCATCGYTYTDNYTDKLEKIVISKSCIVLKEAININFLISDSILVDGRDYVAVIKKGDTVVAEIPYSEWTSNGSYKVITYTGIVAKQMADLYTVVIYDGELKASDERIDGVTEYVKRAIEAGVFTNPENAELATLLVDMLNYGAAAQIQWNYNTDNLANAIVADYQSFATQTEVTFGEDIATNASENYGSTTASLKDRVILNFNFNEGTLEGAAKAIISYTDHYGNEVSYEIAAEDFGTSKGRIIIAVDKLVAADARCIVTCTFVDANGDEIDGIYAQDSIANYCARAIKYYGAGTADANIYESIMKYADAAATYFVEQ